MFKIFLLLKQLSLHHHYDMCVCCVWFLQDLLGVSMIIPLLPKLMFRMYESRSLAGIIGTYIFFNNSLFSFLLKDQK